MFARVTRTQQPPTHTYLCRRDFTVRVTCDSRRRWAFLAGKVLRYGERCLCVCIYASGRRAHI